MTATETETTIPIGDWDDATLARFTAALINECELRRTIPGSDMKALAAFSDAVRAAYAPTGRITLELVPQPHLHEFGQAPDGQPVCRDLGYGEVSWWSQMHETATKKRAFHHIDLKEARDGQVLTVEVPQHWLLARETRVDPSKVVLPDGWASQLGGALADGLKSLPAPVVENTVNIEQDNQPQEVKFVHNPHTGWVESARIEEA